MLSTSVYGSAGVLRSISWQSRAATSNDRVAKRTGETFIGGESFIFIHPTQYVLKCRPGTISHLERYESRCPLPSDWATQINRLKLHAGIRAH